MVLLFCFKQKTAYEMRISDWSSDVCSSDLPAHIFGQAREIIWLARVDERDDILETRIAQIGGGEFLKGAQIVGFRLLPRDRPGELGIEQLVKVQIGRASCGERGCTYV